MNKNINNCIIFGLSNGNIIANQVANITGIKIGKVITSRFADGEILVKAENTVRGLDVFIFQSTSNPVNDNLMELLIAIDSLKRASANSITVIIPYYGYARQDRKAKGREPITCKLVADFLEKAGATKVILIDIHSLQTQGFFSIPVDTLSANCVLISEFKQNNKNAFKDVVVVAPDYGAVKNVRKVAEILGHDIAIMDKRRPKANVVAIENVLGNVQDRDCLLMDDMIDTGGTIIEDIKILRNFGAKNIYVIATHGVFSNNALSKFENLLKHKIIQQIYVSDSIQANLKINIPNFFVVNLADFYAEILISQISHQSISYAHSKYWQKVLRNNE